VNVREALVADPRVLDAAAPAREAAELLTHPHVSSVLVVSDGSLVGCVTASSLVEHVAAGDDVTAMTAGEIADREIETVAPDAGVADVLHVMGERELERLPVVENGRFLGVLLREPLVRRLAEDESGGDATPADVGEGSGAGAGSSV